MQSPAETNDNTKETAAQFGEPLLVATYGLYQLNQKGENLFYAVFNPGFDDTRTRITDAEIHGLVERTAQCWNACIGIPDPIAFVERAKRIEQALNEELFDDLKSIADGRGCYSRDNFQHAVNCIEDAKEKANACIAKLRSALSGETK